MFYNNDVGCTVGCTVVYPSLILAVLYFLRDTFFADTSSARAPVYGPWYLPRFIRGLLAMIRLGTDEDRFLATARQQYGTVVYIPWPLCQTFVFDSETIQKVYAMPTTTLSFTPIRDSMQSYVFGSSKQITGSGVLERSLYQAHSKALANIRLRAPVQRFAEVVEKKVAEMGEKVDAAGGTLKLGLVHWIVDTMFAAATSALFGEEFSTRASDSNLQAHFQIFDSCFPLLASELFPTFLFPFIPPIAKGLKSRAVLVKALSEWVEDGIPGLDEGLVKDMVDITLSEGFPVTETATILFGDLWALQANAPYAAASLLLYVLQSPLLPAIRAEIDSLPTKSSSSTPDVSMATLASLPLMTSCTQETIRLSTSSFSIRLVEKPFILPASASAAPNRGFLIPKGSRITCVTRLAHLSDGIWGDDPPAWDGGRFMDKDGEEALRSRKAKEMRGFGGGVSICEGRHLAAAELKTLLTLTLSAFDIRPLYPTSTDGETPLAPAAHRLVTIEGSARKGILPTRTARRPGLGAFQFDGDVIVEVKRRAVAA